MTLKVFAGGDCFRSCKSFVKVLRKVEKSYVFEKREKFEQLEKITLFLRKNWKKQDGKSFKSRFGLKKIGKNKEEKVSNLVLD